MTPPGTWQRERLPADGSAFDLLRRLHDEGTIEAGPGAMLKAERLYRARADRPWTSMQQANALAALFATDADSYGRIHNRVLELLGETADATVSARADDAHRPARSPQTSSLAPVQAKPADRPENSATSQRSGVHLFRPVARAPWHRRWRNLVRRAWAVALVALALVALVLALRTPTADVQSPDAGPIDAGPIDAGPIDAGPIDAGPIDAGPIDAGPIDAGPIDAMRLVEIEPPTHFDHSNSRYVSTPSVATNSDGQWLAGLSALAAFLLLAGIRWLFLPRRREAIEQKLLKQAVEHRKSVERGGSGVLYDIPRYPPFAASFMEDAATLLGRLRDAAPGSHLDIDATVERCVHNGGQLQPVYAPHRASAPVLVLVDIEKGDHPFLDGVDFLLEHWRRIGLPVERCDFRYQPELLRHAETGAMLHLPELARRRAGRPLLLLSRFSGATNLDGSLPWATHLTAWPQRAILDLDPRPDHERNSRVRAGWTRCQELGIARHPFTGAGLVAAARTLTGGRAPAVPRPDLPHLLDAYRDIETWATVAAYVPDPTWAQLESLRRKFPKVHRPLPSRACVQRLLEWAGRLHRGTDPEGALGQRLDIPRAERTRLINRQRKRDAGLPPEQTLEWDARKFLIAQLERAQSPDESELQRLRRELKRAFHLAVLDPRCKVELLDKFAGTAVDRELRQLLDQERELQRDHAVMVPWPHAVWQTANAWLGKSARVPRKALWRRVAPQHRWWTWFGRVAMVCAVVGLTWASAWLVIHWPSDAHQAIARHDHVPGTLAVPGGADAGPVSIDGAVVVAAAAVDAAPSVRPPRPPRPRVDAGETVVTVVQPGDGGVAQEEKVILVPPLQRIPGGTFTMGTPEKDKEGDDDERPVRDKVRIRAFDMCRTEITQAQWTSVMDRNPSDCDYGCSDDHPVQSVSWMMAIEYLNKLSQKQNLTACYDVTGASDARWKRGCNGYRLPTEAEWEYAARADTDTRYHFGDDADKLGDYAWYSENSNGKAHTVARKKPNPWQLRDMHGNVDEWVWDWYGTYQSTRKNNPRGPSSGTYRVLRGGSFVNWARYLRSALRDWNMPTLRFPVLGFRCARDVPST